MRMSRRLSALQAHLNPAALAASAALQEKPRKPAPLYIESVPKLLTDEQKYEFVSIVVVQCGCKHG